MKRNSNKNIYIKGAKLHNLKNIDVEIPRNKLTIITGLSGSGKSSLLHLLALLDEPSKGKILINNKETMILNEDQKDEIRRNNISIISSPIRATYDSPFTLPMNRRNEAMFKIVYK